MIRHIAPYLLGGALFGLSLSASAAEITLYSGGAVKAALSEAAANYGKATGHHVAVEYAPMGPLLRRLAEGATPDGVVLTMDVMADAEAKGWVLPGTATAVGGVGVGVAVHEFAAAPDISTPEAFRQALLAAKSITYIDPAKGTSGKHFAEVLRRLGIAEAVKQKTTLGDAGYVVEPVARGEIELGIQQITEILPVKGVKLVGPLPEPLQKITVYAAALTPFARDAQTVRDFLAYLRGAEARGIFSSKGFLAP
ncbi:MAG: substrate-binding domain-containing protein [Rhodocyclales bacterium]|nr:substrate-binding domain-containing protein [Rhodocyclales bacterium]